MNAAQRAALQVEFKNRIYIFCLNVVVISIKPTVILIIINEVNFSLLKINNSLLAFGQVGEIDRG